MTIHPTAIVSKDAEIHESVEIGPFVVVDSDVIIGEGCILESSCRIYSGTRMGKNNRIFQGASLGGVPQDLGFNQSMKTGLAIGDDNVFREFIVIHRSTNPEKPTSIGNRNYLMGGVHFAHDCQVGNDNIAVQHSIMAGHVHIGNFVFISGLVAVHQFNRIGDYSMLAGCAKVVQDVPPFATADGNPCSLIGINAVGLKRAGFAPEVRSEIKNAYKKIFNSKIRTTQAIDDLAEGNPGPEVQSIIDFFRNSKRGVTDHR